MLARPISETKDCRGGLYMLHQFLCPQPADEVLSIYPLEQAGRIASWRGSRPVLGRLPSESLRKSFEILCVGRLTPAKGQHLLIDALWSGLRSRGWPVRLRLVGGGTDEASLRQRAAQIENSQSVIFEGAVNQNYIRTLYAKADLFCIPSFAEGIPVVLMEAMAMGIPCVTTHVAGIPELIRDGV
jgi:glycosyltransferase involved in cell wall biosynthesis